MGETIWTDYSQVLIQLEALKGKTNVEKCERKLWQGAYICTAAQLGREDTEEEMRWGERRRGEESITHGWGLSR